MTVFFSEEKVRQRGKVAYRDGYVKLRGRNVHYVDYGGAGEIVVALHGYVQNAHAFDGNRSGSCAPRAPVGTRCTRAWRE